MEKKYYMGEIWQPHDSFTAHLEKEIYCEQSSAEETNPSLNAQ